MCAVLTRAVCVCILHPRERATARSTPRWAAAKPAQQDAAGTHPLDVVHDVGHRTHVSQPDLLAVFHLQGLVQVVGTTQSAASTGTQRQG